MIKLLLLLVNISQAGYISNTHTCTSPYYSDLADCLAVNANCVDQDDFDYNCETHSWGKVSVDDLEKPIIIKSAIESCRDQLHCNQLFDAKVCIAQGSSKAFNDDEVFCAKQNGFKKKLIDGFKINNAKEAAYREKVAAQARRAQVILNKRCGASVLDEFDILKADASLSDKLAIQEKISAVRGLLSSGSLSDAKSSLTSVTTNSAFAPADKLKLNQLIDDCLGE